jgi:hypothetical protein
MSAAMAYLQELTEPDLLFLVSSLVTKRQDHQHLCQLLQDKPDLIDIMLDDERLFPLVRDDWEVITRISPFLLFTILLRQMNREFRQQISFMERTTRDYNLLSNLADVRQALCNRELCAYLAKMLSTFTRVECAAAVSKSRGHNYQRQLQDLNFDEILELVTVVEIPQRFHCYKRLADIALFLCGIYPEALQPERHGDSRLPARLAGSRPRSLRDLELEGKRYYDLASGYEEAEQAKLNHVLSLLAGKFSLACKLLNYLVENYISRYRSLWFA